MYIFFGILGLVLVIIIVCVAINQHRKAVEKFKADFVANNSTQLKEINKINDAFRTLYIGKKRIADSTRLDSKKAFDTFDSKTAVRNAFFNKRTEISQLIERVTKEKALIQEYYQKVRAVPPTDFDNLPKTKYVTKTFFSSLESQLATKAIMKLETGLTVTIRWSYTSPAGRRSYSDSRVFDYEKTVETFNSIFKKPAAAKKEETADQRKNYHETLKKEPDEQKAENNKINESVKIVRKALTKSVYRVSDVVEMYKELGVAATKPMAEATLSSAGYKLSKYPGFYILSSIKNVSDLILASSNEWGLIAYDNQFKDDEYDNAIAKLEKEGRIVPIDNLHFLKISKNLNYCGMTIDEIDEFESLLLKFARKQLFVSFKQIKENIDCLVTRIEFDECFLQTIVKYCGFLTPVPGIDKLYTTIQKPQRIMFLEWLLKGKKSVDAFDLIYDLKELYDIEYNIYSITYDLDKNKTKLYYNEEMEKIYSNKEYFFEELEDVL